MSNQSTNEASAEEAGDRVRRARDRRARDELWLSEARTGEAGSYRQLVDEWAPGAFDRALHRGADERSAAEAVQRTFTTLQSQLDVEDTSFGARVMGSIERDVPARPRALGKANRGAKRAGERLTRGTDPAALGADPSISVMLWDALDVLGDRARDITDLHWRHNLASDEIAAATGESVVRVDDIIRKAPQGLGAALRTRLLWAGGKPDHDELTRDLKANNVRQFDSTAVRVIHAHLRACSVCRSRSLIALPGIDIFANIPLVAMPGDVERRISSITWAPMAAGAAVTGSAVAAAASDVDTAAATIDETGVDDYAAPSNLDQRSSRSTGETAAVAGTAAAAGAAAAAFLGTTDAASADTLPTETGPTETGPTETGPTETELTGAGAPVVEPPAEPAFTPIPEPTPAPLAPEITAEPPVPETKVEPEPEPEPKPDPEPKPAPAAAFAGASAVPLAALTKTPTAPSAPIDRSDAGPAHEPVTSRAADRDDGRPKWLIPAGIAAAAILILGLVLVLTRGGGEQTAIDAGPLVETTTTTRPSSATTTTERPIVTTTIAPPTTQTTPSTTGSGGGGGGGGGGGQPVTTTTKAPAIVATVTPGMSPATIRENSATGALFSWSVNANGPVTVSVTGPGVSSSSLSGSQTVCAPATTCGVGIHYFSIVVKDLDGRQVGAGTGKLIINT